MKYTFFWLGRVRAEDDRSLQGRGTKDFVPQVFNTKITESYQGAMHLPML